MRRLILLFGALVSGPVLAFHVEGFWSGMTPMQLAATAATHGLVAQPGQPGQWYLGTASPPRMLGKFGFCGNYLVSYTRNILSDADYAGTLTGIFSTYGPPRKMNFSGDVTTGDSAGAFRATGYTQWERGADRVRMTSHFDWRLYQGEMQREQPASVIYEILSPCTLP